MMKKLILTIALLAAAPAWAGCYADYKAKRDNPLRLHYGVIELPDEACSRAAAREVIAARIGRDGWRLLEVMAIFDDAGLGSRQGSAGEYFLRY